MVHVPGLTYMGSSCLNRGVWWIGVKNKLNPYLTDKIWNKSELAHKVLPIWYNSAFCTAKFMIDIISYDCNFFSIIVINYADYLSIPMYDYFPKEKKQPTIL